MQTYFTVWVWNRKYLEENKVWRKQSLLPPPGPQKKDFLIWGKRGKTFREQIVRNEWLYFPKGFLHHGFCWLCAGKGAHACVCVACAHVGQTLRWVWGLRGEELCRLSYSGPQGAARSCLGSTGDCGYAFTTENVWEVGLREPPKALMGPGRMQEQWHAFLGAPPPTVWVWCQELASTQGRPSIREGSHNT